MKKTLLLKKYKPGNKNYEILSALIKERKTVSYKDLFLQSEPNPVKKILAMENPELWKKEKRKLNFNIYRLNRENKRIFEIRSNQKKQGYCLKVI